MIRSFMAAGLIQYTAIVAPVSVPTPPADQPAQADHWQPVYVHKVYPKPRAIEYQPRSVQPVFVTDTTVAPQTWQVVYPDRLARRLLPTSAQPSLNAPPFQPPDTFASGGQFIATGSIKHLLQYQSHAGPFFEQLVEQPAETALVSRYAEYGRRARALISAQHLTWAADKFDPPAAATVPDIQPPVLAQVRRLPYPRAVYTPAQPHFAVTIQVPVMSWTGIYLDPPPRRRVRYQPDHRPFPIDFDVTINPPAPLFSWTPEHPDKIDRRPSRIHLFAARTDALHVPDVTNPVTVLSWQGSYADRVPAKPALRAALQLAWASDKFTAPAAVTAPDLATPVFVDRVHGRRRTAHHKSYLAPDFVPDVTNPVGGIEWLAIYPDRIDRDTLPVYAKLSWTGAIFITEFIPTPVIGEIEGRGSYVRRIFGKASYDPTLRGKGSL